MIRSFALAATLVAGAVPAAFAQAPQIPTPVNPFPVNPIATNGTPLPSQAAVGSPYGYRGTAYSGRSVGFDAPAAIVAPVAPIGGFVGDGLGVVGSTIGGIGETTGAVVGGVLGR